MGNKNYFRKQGYSSPSIGDIRPIIRIQFFICRNGIETTWNAKPNSMGKVFIASAKFRQIGLFRSTNWAPFWTNDQVQRDWIAPTEGEMDPRFWKSFLILVKYPTTLVFLVLLSVTSIKSYPPNFQRSAWLALGGGGGGLESFMCPTVEGPYFPPHNELRNHMDSAFELPQKHTKA